LSRQVDQDIVPIAAEPLDFLHEEGAALLVEDDMVRTRKWDLERASRPVARLEEPMHALLPSVAIDDENLHRAVRQRHGAIEGERRLSDSTLLVRECHDVRAGAAA